jgi:hypothetical protein
VKFIKETIVGDTTDGANLKVNIAAAQTIHENLTTAVSELVDDSSMSKGERARKTQEEAMWRTVALLLEAFRDSIPEAHPLFKATNQLCPPGYNRLFKCYDKGLERLRRIVLMGFRGSRLKSIKHMTTNQYEKLLKEGEPPPPPTIVIDPSPVSTTQP